MGLGHSPSIVINGLVLALDAANPKSYTGSGTTWTDLIGRGNTGTLTNGPTYSSTSGGSIVFDGTNDNVSIGTNGFSFGSSPGTLSAWAKTRDRTSTGTIVSYGNAATNGARFLGIGQSNFYFSGYGSSIAASGLSYDTWFNLVGVYDGTNASMYVNGALVAGPTARSWNTTASNAGIGKNVSNNEYWQGDVAQVQIYNRALSAAEIQQNYNAFKGRYATYISGEEPTITVSVAPASTDEDGVTNLVYTFTSDRIVTNNVTVNYSISGTATNGVDYTTISTSVVIPTGSSSATVTVNPTLDGTVESDETVILTLANGEYVIGSPSSATGTILNDDGNAEYTSPGTYYWTCPSNVFSVSAVCIGAGGRGGGYSTSGTITSAGGGGGGLGWGNNIPVTPGQSYLVVVGAPGQSPTSHGGTNGINGGDSYFVTTTTVRGGGGSNGWMGRGGGSFVGDGGGGGGSGSSGTTWGGGGGGAGGYSGNGGSGGSATGSGGNPTTGSGGAGGGTAHSDTDSNDNIRKGGAGGGVGIYGKGSDGSGAPSSTYGGFGGFGGSGGTNGSSSNPHNGGNGGSFGGGSGGGNEYLLWVAGDAAGTPGGGAVRIIWGTGRSYPSAAS